MNFDYLILKGPMGVGKTTTALYLTKRLREEGYKCSFISFDKFYTSCISSKFDEEKLKETGEIIVPLVENLRKRGYFCIIEGVFFDFLHKPFCSNLSGRIINVSLNAPLELCLSRNNQRESYKKLSEKRVTSAWHTTQTELSGIVLDSKLSTADVSDRLYTLIMTFPDRQL